MASMEAYSKAAVERAMKVTLAHGQRTRIFGSSTVWWKSLLRMRAFSSPSSPSRRTAMRSVRRSWAQADLHAFHSTEGLALPVP